MGFPYTLTSGTLARASQVMTNLRNTGWIDLGNNSTGVAAINLTIAHSATTFSGINGTAIYQSTDSGRTWTSKNTDLDAVSLIVACKADKTDGFAIETGAAAQECAYTSDSGATWTTKTSAAFAADIYDVSFSTTGLIVLAGDDDVGAKHIVFSTDNGANWTDATTSPSAKCYCVDMYDANTGYAVDSSNNIWKTTNGGVDWTDTTHNTTSILKTSKIWCLSATTALITTTHGVWLYNNGAGTVTLLQYVGGSVSPSGGGSAHCGLVVTSSGNYYLGTDGGTNNNGIQFYRSFNSGTSWSVLPTGIGVTFTQNAFEKCMMCEYGTDNILLTIWGVPHLFNLT